MIKNTLAMAVGLMAGVAASQFPEFAQQYRQRLGGAVDELRYGQSLFEKDARASGLTADQAIERMRGSPDDLSRNRAGSEMVLRDRLPRLQEHQAMLKDSGPLLRLWSFAGHADGELASRTLDDFEPAVPVSSEGFVLGGAGAAGGYLLARLVLWPFGGRRRPRYS